MILEFTSTHAGRAVPASEVFPIMTKHKDFKALVRARMRSTGESYTVARAALMIMPQAIGQQPDTARDQQQVIINRWFEAGRLRSIPARRKVRAAVLLEVLSRFVPGTVYSEYEVSRLLEQLHPDFAYLRRELVGLGYLERRAGQYRVCRTPPVRTEQQRRELPAWEGSWLPLFLTREPTQAVREAS